MARTSVEVATQDAWPGGTSVERFVRPAYLASLSSWTKDQAIAAAFTGDLVVPAKTGVPRIRGGIGALASSGGSAFSRTLELACHQPEFPDGALDRTRAYQLPLLGVAGRPASLTAC